MPARDLEDRTREALGLVSAHARDPKRAAGFADEAVLLAEELEDPVLLAQALAARLATHAGPDAFNARLSTSLRLFGLVREVPDADVRLDAHLWRLTTGLEQLDLSTVRRQLAALDLLADETREDRARFYASSRRAMFALTEGDAVGAGRLAAEAADAVAGVPEGDAVLQTLRAELARQRGDRAGLAQQAGSFESLGQADDRIPLLAQAAVLWLECGERERSRRLVDLLWHRLDELPRDADWLLVVSKVCEAAAAGARPEVATRCADLLAPYAGRGVLDTTAGAFAGVVDDYLALATGDLEQTVRARAAYRRLGADWWARRGPLGRPQEPYSGVEGPRILHLHPTESDGPARLWCVGREGALRTVPSMPGLTYLRLLIQQPGVDVPVLELSEAARAANGDSGTGTLVDQQALAEHRQRMRDEPAPAERASDSDRAKRTEQARADVRRSIRTALARLELHDGEVVHELRTTIRTGATCRYDPDAFRPVEWHLSAAHRASQPDQAQQSAQGTRKR